MFGKQEFQAEATESHNNFPSLLQMFTDNPLPAQADCGHCGEQSDGSGVCAPGRPLFCSSPQGAVPFSPGMSFLLTFTQGAKDVDSGVRVAWVWDWLCQFPGDLGKETSSLSLVSTFLEWG